MAFTNVDDDTATAFYLARKGYGTVDQIEQWDTPKFLDAVEYEQIQQDIELYHYQQQQRES